MVNGTLAYEIGGIFLLCALLMLGTVGGFLPRTLRGGKHVVWIGVLLILGWVAYRHWPELAGSLASLGGSSPAAVTPASAKQAPAKPLPPQPPKWKTTVIDSSVPAAAPGPAPSPEPDAVPESAEPVGAKETAGSPQEGGMKRAVKRVGRLLHIGKKEER